jgi:hypothetical protein
LPSILKISGWLPGLLLAATVAHAQTLAHIPNVGSSSLLPDAPQPAQQSASQQKPLQPTPPGKPASGKAGSVDHASYQKRKWAQYVDPGEHVPRLDAHDKMVFWLHEEARPSSLFPALLSAGYGQLADSPDYGSDSGAFGDRLGAALIRQATMRFFCSSVFPTVVGEDPRYYRKAQGSYFARAGWAAEQSVVGRRDSGRRTFNISNIFGHLAASALTPAYYPGPSVSAHVVFQTWATSIAGSAGNNLFLEFWPDVVNELHKKIHSQRSSTSAAE